MGEMTHWGKDLAMSVFRSGLGAVVAGLVLVSCAGNEASSVEKRQSALPLPVTFTLTAPLGVSPLAPVLESATSLVIGASAKVNPSAPVVAMGATGTTRAEPGAVLNDLWSRGPTDLRDRVKINGFVHAKTLTLGNGVVVDPAKIDRAPVFDPISTLSWTVTFPATPPTDDVILTPPEKSSIVPGYYGQVTLNTLNNQASELTLQSGTYYIDSLTLNSNTKIWLDQSQGPVLIYVSQVVAFRATFAALDGSAPDLFVGYSGSPQLFVEANYRGALVAPNATVTIRSVAVPHSGFFAGKSVELDANAVVNYAYPTPIIGAATPDETTCRAMVPLRAGLVGNAQLQQYAKDLARYCGLCRSTHDSDSDGVWDCVDDCPNDPAKTKPGIAGCGYSDVPSGPDGIPRGIDQCDQDPRNIAPGDCGCVGQANKKPASTPCFDPVCPGQTNPTCDGNGICGTTNCKAQPDCVPFVFQGHAYQFCGAVIPQGTPPAVPKNESGAFNACTAKGLVMARVDTYEQNQRIQGLLRSFNIAEAWLGGNQTAVANAWRWAKLSNLSGDQFWSGGATGSRVGDRFAFWALGRPGTGKCLAMQSSDGHWVDKDCALALPFVCENPPVPNSTGPAGSGDTGSGSGDVPIPRLPAPLSAACVSETGGSSPLPGVGQMAQLMDQYNKADAGVYTGAASSPPTTAGCPAATGENCPLKNVQPLLCADGVTECDCAGENARRPASKPDICAERFGTGYICLAAKVDPNCKAVDAGDADCPTKSVCGVPNCVATAPKYPGRCNQVDICAKGTTDTFTFRQPDPGSDFNPVTIKPSDAFFTTPPSTVQSPQYQDNPDAAHTGKNHVWCQLNPQDASKVKPANTDMNKQGASGGGSPIKVSFTPDLIFKAEPNPLAFGQSNMLLDAQAKMSARVDLASSVLAPSGVGIEVFSAGIGIFADRCRVSTAETQLFVFGQNISLSKYIPTFDTDALAGTQAFGRDCRKAVGGFIVTADRVKKAFRDAQQLIKQYQALKDGNLQFDGNLCHDLGIDQLGSKSFPLAGVCPDGETPEMTINRFIDYFQRDKLGQVDGLREAVTFLSTASTSLRTALLQALGIDDGYDLAIPFIDFKRSESKTLVKTPFAIGPVPMLLEIAVVAGYGVNGAFNLNLSFPADLDHSIGNLSNPDAPDPAPVAKVSATVEPWASAGMTIFVGANFGIGSIGIEGGVTLAKISAPIAAGVGLAVATVEDTRDIPSDIKSAAQYIGKAPQYIFGPPKAFQFYLMFQYGASIDLNDVLAGEVNGRLTIDFWLFSRTWRKRIVKFNGWSQHFPLINASGATTYIPIVGSGTGTVTASGNNTGMGRAESPLPFFFLQKLYKPVDGTGGPTVITSDFPAGGAGGGGGASGAAGAGGASGAGGLGGAGNAPLDKSQVEQFSYDNLCCAKQGESCSLSNRPGCCEPLNCVGATDTTPGTCEPKAPPACGVPNAKCGFDQALGVSITCCSGDVCPKSGFCPPPVVECKGFGEVCDPDAVKPCCDDGMSCLGNGEAYVCFDQGTVG